MSRRALRTLYMPPGLGGGLEDRIVGRWTMGGLCVWGLDAGILLYPPPAPADYCMPAMKARLPYRSRIEASFVSWTLSTTMRLL